MDCKKFLPKVGTLWASPYVSPGDVTLGRVVDNKQTKRGEPLIVLEDIIEPGKLHRKMLRILLERCRLVTEKEVPIIQAAYEEAGPKERDARRAARATTKGLVRLRCGLECQS